MTSRDYLYAAALLACWYFAERSRRHAVKLATLLQEAKRALARWWQDQEPGR